MTTVRRKAMTVDTYFPDTAAGADRCISANAGWPLRDKIDAAKADGTGQWIPDPYVPMVWGFQVNGTVQVIAYLTGAGDFETSDEWYL